MSNLANKSLTEAWKDIYRAMTLRHYAQYVIGMLAIGVGVGPMIRSNVGVSSWDTFSYAVSQLADWIEFGYASWFTATLIMILTIWLYRNKVFLIMAVPIVLVSLMIVFFDQIVYVNLSYTASWQHIIGFTFGMLMLPLGGSLMIATPMPAGVYDEFMVAVLKAVKSSNIPLVRAIIELTVVTLAFLVGQIAGIGIGRIGIGTLLFSVLVGVFITIYLKLLERLGLYEPQQIN